MAIFKCKMCGGDLEIAEGVSIAECEYCGTKQTLPKVTDENMNALFNRATTLRRKGEFDKAEKIYERVIQASPDQAEAYWGLILCKYGIEYVDDPATFKKIPTCHRASYDSIIADDDYKSAVNYADMGQRALYEDQAREIDRIQKEILALAEKEERYDVFICYKETDADGKRTQDSVIANEIYYQLTEQGYKVFYAAITLEGKLGSAYEPIIFAALNSSKVMLSIGTRPEYFNAVWVKNEWSRYLKIVKKDRSKMLIPCYRDMDAYELPEEFAHLQAQDMSKIGFINDLVRGIKKVVKKDEPKAAVVKETVIQETVQAPSYGVSPLLKRASLALEDGEFDRADEFCEQALNIEPECAEAYLGKLMVELRTRTKEELKNRQQPFDGSNYYKKIIRFGDNKLKTFVNDCINTINERNARAAFEAEQARLEGIYVQAKNKMRTARIIDTYKEALRAFESIKEYKDSAALIEECKELIDLNRYNFAKAIMEKAEDEQGYLRAIKEFEAIKEYKNSAALIEECRELIKERDYSLAIDLMSEAEKVNDYLHSIDIFEKLGTFRDSKEQIQKCRAAITVLEAELEIKAKREKKKKIIITASIVGTLLLFTFLTIFVFVPFGNYAVGIYSPYINIYGVTDFEVPDGVTQISAGAFAGCDRLESVKIPDSVKVIGNDAFEGCSSLTSITIPDSVTSIGKYAFEGCTSLTSITIPDSVTSIGRWAFHRCSSLTSITLPFVGATKDGTSNTHFGYIFGAYTILYNDDYVPSSLKTVIITGVTSIGNDAFYNCSSLTSIEIPDSVTSIGDYAFRNCSRLKTVYYTGTESEWSKIDIGYDNYYLTNATIVYNYVPEN